MIRGDNLFDSLFVAINEGVVLHQVVIGEGDAPQDFRVVNVNPAFQHLTGLEKQQVIDQLASQAYGENSGPLLEKFAVVVASGAPAYHEFFFQRINKHFHVSIFFQPPDLCIVVFTDVTLNQQNLSVLKQAKQELLEAQRISHTGSWRLDLATSKQVWSEEMYLMLGLDPSKPPPEYEQAERLFTEESWARLSGAIANTAQNGEPYELEMEMIRADGSRGWMLGRGEAVRDLIGNIVALRGVAVDITKSKKTQLELIDQKEFVDKLINIQVDTFFLFDAHSGEPIRWNDSFVYYSDYSDDEIAKMRAPFDFMDPQELKKAEEAFKETLENGTGAVELNLVNRQGTRIPFEYRIKLIKDNDGRELLLSLGRDITERKRAEEQFRRHESELRRIAHYDTLTGVPNRFLLSDRMKQAIAQASRENSVIAVCYLDLDGFKEVNDRLGHIIGDQVLVEVAGRILKVIRASDTLARLGGDEFVVLLKDFNLSNECLVTLDRLLESISRPFHLGSVTCSVSASIGVSIYPLEEEDPDTLLRHADHAMYVAKQSGKNRYHIYDPAQERIARDNHEYLERISYGLKHNQFQLFYQPKINLKTKELIGVEALIRWWHPDRGLIPPAEFLPKIDNTQLDIELGEWVVASAMAQLDQWLKTGLNVQVSVNISGFHIEAPDFITYLKKQLALYPDVPPCQFQIEVLETIALTDVAVVRNIIKDCQDMGVKFALDDFGTGYSSLSYLSRLPVDVLKIDQSFVRDMLEDKGDRSIVQGIIALAKTFNRQIVAEGIETEAHYQALLELGCEMGQGYYIARPMPAEQIRHWRASQD